MRATLASPVSQMWAEVMDKGIFYNLKDGPPKKEGRDYETTTEYTPVPGNPKAPPKETNQYAILVDGQRPMVPQQSEWLSWLNYKKFDIPAEVKQRWMLLCVPFMFNKCEPRSYARRSLAVSPSLGPLPTFAGATSCPHPDACIFGLSGSVGGPSELDYLEKTFAACVYPMPLFLETCEKTHKQPAKNLGVELKPSKSDQLDAVVELALKHHVHVPVIVITQGQQVLPRALVAPAEAPPLVVSLPTAGHFSLLHVAG